MSITSRSKFATSMKKRKGVKVGDVETFVRSPAPSLMMTRKLGGGFPKGYISEIYGKTGTGKTTMALLYAKQRIDAGESVLYLDFELAIEKNWVSRVGVDIDALDDQGNELFTLIQAEDMERGLQLLIDVVRGSAESVAKGGNPVFDHIIIDSVGAAAPKAQIETSLDKTGQLGLHSKLIGTFSKAFRNALKESGITVLSINQARANFDGYTHNTTGGMAWDHVVMCRIITMDNVKMDDAEDGKIVNFRWRMTKSKIADFSKDIHSFVAKIKENGPFVPASALELYDVAREMGLLLNSKGEPHVTGNVYYKDVNLGGKRESAVKTLVTERQDLAAELLQEVWERIEDEKEYKPGSWGENPENVDGDLPEANDDNSGDEED